MNRHGHLTFRILASLSNRWLTRLEAMLPKLYLATHFSDVNGEIRTSAPQGCWVAKWVAGPDPIDRPIIRTSSSWKFIMLVTKFQTGSMSLRMASSEGSPG